MTPEQRVAAAVNLEPTDRTPIAPLTDFFISRYVGSTVQDLLADEAKCDAALQKVHTDLGRPDMVNKIHNYLELKYNWPMRMKYPGKDLPADSMYQVIEETNFEASEYEIIARDGFRAFKHNYIMPRVRPDWDPGKVAEEQEMIARGLQAFVRRWADRGVPALMGGNAPVPSTAFAYARGIRDFLIDLHRVPEAVQAAMEVTLVESIEGAKKSVALTGVRRVWVNGNRSCCEYMSPKLWEKFVWPYLYRLVNALADDGIVSLLHFDGDWNLNLPYFRELPAKSCILELDGVTDIFKAKEVLGDRMCMMGDVPATMLALGSREEVEAYCKKLIDVVGEGGGLILSSGCSVPIDARAENIKAMFDVAHTYKARN